MPNVLGKVFLAQPIYQLAVKREVRPQNVHISDESALETYYNLGARSRTHKRYGSFVPGPLESRRRLGKRRMAHAFQSIPCYKSDLWSWWRYLRGTDLTDWKWQPPRSITPSLEPRNHAAQSLLRSWLIEPFDTIKKNQNISLVSGPQHNSNDLLLEEISCLQAAIRGNSTDTIINACQALTYNLARTLDQSIICEKQLLRIVEKVSDELKEKLSDLKFATCLCSFFQTAWEGSRILTKNNVTILPNTTIFILEKLSKLPFIPEIQDLITSVIRFSPYQGNEKDLYKPYLNILTLWAMSWHKNHSLMNPVIFINGYPRSAHEGGLSDAEKNVLNVEQMFSNIQKEICKGMSKNDLNISLQNLKLEILTCLKAIENAEKVLIPEKLSSSNLLKTIGYLPQNIVNALLKDCSEKLCEKFCQYHPQGCLNIKKYWLLSISQVDALTSEEFLNIWKYMDAHSMPLPEILNPLILIHMLEFRGNSKCLALIRNSLEITELESNEGYEPWVSLISAIYKYDSPELHFNKIGHVFHILFLLGKLDLIGKTILNMSSINPRLPTEILEFIVEITTDHDPKTAWKIVMLSYTMQPGRKYRSESFPRGDFRTLRFSYCPKFVIWMISNSKLNPRYIWKILKIPIHAKFSPRYRNQPSSKPLDAKEINLLKAMANAFAYSERLRPRVAFRNVMQCWHHLRHHRTPIDSTILHALLHSGIARCVENDQWIPQGRQAWILSLVEQVEGNEMAKKVDKALEAWNLRVTYRKNWIRRELNVLRVGQTY